MLNSRLLHPEILQALGRAGHGSRVLIADGNYPFSTESPTTAAKVFLNLRRGLVSVTDVLEVLTETIPIESAVLMEPSDRALVPLHKRVRELLPATLPIEKRQRHDFYAEARAATTALVIATGEERRFANVLLTIGVVKSEPS